jgi:hypothetical protein
MLKKIISLFVLTVYLHSMSGYAMVFHKCTITGFEQVYTGYGLEDPCAMEDIEMTGAGSHVVPADCCDLQQTIISVDDDSNISYFKTQFPVLVATPVFLQPYIINNYTSFLFDHQELSHSLRPPEPCSICVFRI